MGLRATIHQGTPITKTEYDALDEAGLITRPLTDAPLGGTTANKRDADAHASAAWTEPDSAVPSRMFEGRET